MKTLATAALLALAATSYAKADACLFTLDINNQMPVYASPDPNSQPVDHLNTNDKVCVMSISGQWTQVHWNVGTSGYTGYLYGLNVAPHREPGEPMPSEHEYAPPPPQAPPSDQHSENYRGQEAPNSAFVVRPTEFVMVCRPENSTPYVVGYGNGKAGILGSKSGHLTPYNVEDVTDNPGAHIMYVKIDRPDQNRSVYLAFDYSRRGNDASAIRVKAPGGYDARDKCFMDWENTK